MVAAGTIADRCASLSSVVSQIITDTTDFSRRLRSSRHEINPINADLLALKLSLDIAQDDFLDVDVQFPPLVIEACAGLLECCACTTQSLHKPIIHLLASDLQNEIWKVFRKRDLERLRQDVEALKCAFDLLLDLLVLLNDNNEGTDQVALIEKYVGKPSIGGYSFLKRIDIERDHVESLTEGRLPALYTAFEKMRACATFVLEEKSLLSRPEVRIPSRDPSRNPSRVSSRDPSRVSSRIPTRVPSRQSHVAELPGDDPQPVTNAVDEPSSPISTANGIGAWIRNVILQKAPLPVPAPSVYSESSRISMVASSSRQRNVPSQETFYAESITSGSRTQSSGLHLSYASEAKSAPRIDSPNDTMKILDVRPVTHYTTSTMISSDEASGAPRYTSKNITSARENRNRLTRQERIAIDQELKSITRYTLTDAVDGLLWEGADPNVEDEEFGFLYIRAAFELPVEILQLLVHYGADITTILTSSYSSAVHAAVLGKQYENLQYLVSLGVPIDTPNAIGETPLHQAVRMPGGHQIAKCLLEAGADVNRPANGDVTPLHVVMKTTKLDSRERSMLVELLLAHGADGDLGVETVERRGKGLSVLGLI